MAFLFLWFNQPYNKSKPVVSLFGLTLTNSASNGFNLMLQTDNCFQKENLDFKNKVKYL